MEERKITLVDDDQTLEFYVVEETKLNGATIFLSQTRKMTTRKATAIS